MTNTENPYLGPADPNDDVPYEPPPPAFVPAVPVGPRIWPAFTVAFGVILAGLIVSGIAFFIAVFTIGEVPLSPPPTDLNVETLFAKIASHPAGLWFLVVPGQLCFLVAAWAAAALSPQKITERLRLRRGNFPIWTWLLMAVATPAVSFLISLVLSSSESEPSQQLKVIEDMLTTQGGTRFFVTAILIAVAPGICEELVFRGYLQSRLLQRWTVSSAICVSAAIFALAHVDPMHAVAVFPLGIWLGVVAWRCDSILPAMLCHFTTNLFALCMSQFKGGEEATSLTATDMMIFVPCLIAMAACIFLFTRKPPSRTIEIA